MGVGATPLAGCRLVQSGTEPTPDAASEADARSGEDGPEDEPVSAERPEDLAPEKGPPMAVGCSDGTREGFLDLAAWRGIAGCAGGWSVPGLLAGETDLPRCDRLAGNTSANPAGSGCSVGDLCADDWHVCDGPEDVAAHSPTLCQGATLYGEGGFFAARAGATPSGICTGDPRAVNDLHGCGSIGDRDSPSCWPLDRVLGFAQCGATAVWRCGGSPEWLMEALVVTKAGPSQGGVLCCRD